MAINGIEYTPITVAQFEQLVCGHTVEIQPDGGEGSCACIADASNEAPWDHAEETYFETITGGYEREDC